MQVVSFLPQVSLYFKLSRREFQDTKACRRFKEDLLLFDIRQETNLRRKHVVSFEFTSVGSLIAHSREIIVSRKRKFLRTHGFFISNDYPSCWGHTTKRRAGFSPLEVSSKVLSVFSDFRGRDNSKYRSYGMFFFLRCKTGKAYLGKTTKVNYFNKA